MVKKLTRTQLVTAAAQLAAATVEKDPAIADTLAMLEGVKGVHELGALHFYRYLDALERLQEAPLPA